jgi:hypothetical protein
VAAEQDATIREFAHGYTGAAQVSRQLQSMVTA